MTASNAEKTIVPLNDKRSETEGKTPADGDMNQRLVSIQDLLFGDARREIVGRLDHGDDRHREFADNTALQMQMLTEMFDKKIEALRQEIRAIDQAQTAKRRKLVGDLGSAIKAMAYDA